MIRILRNQRFWIIWIVQQSRDGQETELKESLGDFRAPGAPGGWGLGSKWGFNMF